MRSKDFWHGDAELSSPFDLPRRVLGSLKNAFRGRARRRAPEPVKYIWLYLDEVGLRHHEHAGREAPLDLNGWLNLIDESAALGAQWLVVRVGGPLSKCADVWDICKWAQQSHGIHVGLHLDSADMDEDDIAELNQLDVPLTHLLADRAKLPAFQFLKDLGFQVSEADISADERGESCANPESIACAGPDGTLYSCGLVSGETEHALGNAQVKRLDVYMNDGSVPHSITNTRRYPIEGCSGCPPFMAKRLANLQGR